MQTFIKSGNARLWIYVGSLVIMAGLWKSGEAINSRLAGLPIKTAPKAAERATSIDQKSFYAVWVKRLTSSSPEIIEDDQAVENLFNKKEEKLPQILTPEKPPEPDYGEIFKRNAQITGISNDGIFINRKFYRIGQKLDHLAIPTEAGKPIIPVLQSIQNGKVTFNVGKKQVVFVIGKE